ncbi:hypothetical protein G4O51_12415 [Candidatus Bathyarchaeota archaeon A05DMB-2]|jgi:hypothetical protein|nr:hypothetical protein [Candidatus Bathyarchaeota archaeon A05DMB-2]
MGTVPNAYYDFVMQYAPYFYVIATKMSQDPPSGQKDVVVEDGSKFQVGYPVEIKDDAHAEWNKVASINGNVLTMENNLQYTYYVAKNGKVEGPNPDFGRGAFPAAFAIDFLYEAYGAKQFESAKTDILNKIVELANFILTQQCTDPNKRAYGGFKNSETGTEYWSIDAGRCIPPLLKAYKLTNTADYLNAAVLAGATFLYNMQHKPSELGVHDKYYGGFARYVTIADAWSQPMNVEDLYDFIGLKMLAETYDTANKTRYETMMSDAVAFLRSGFEDLYLWFDPKPSGDGKWHRVGINETEVYDDPMSFALLGLYTYEGWSLTCQRVYNFIQTIRASAQYPAYHPAICWPGYIDVVTRFPACAYYDAVTSGILWKIRAAHDKSSLAFSMQIIKKYQEEFMFWGPKFEDYSPITEQKAMANVSWLAQLFLNYEEPVTPFTRILRCKGESALLYPIRQAADKVTYSEPLDIKVIVSPTRVDEILIEPGYMVNDYITVYTFAPLRQHDKIRRKGEDYEVLGVQAFDFAGETAYFKANCRRLMGQ